MSPLSAVPGDVEAEPPIDRRGLERRIEMLERDFRQIDTKIAVMEATLNGLVSTMDSRHKAFERGQDLILKGIDQLEKAQVKQEKDLTALTIAPQDLSKLMFSPSMVLGTIMIVASIISGQIASTWGMRSDLRDLSTQATLVQKLQEERSVSLRSAVDNVQKKQELQQIQYQELREAILGQPRRSP